MAKMSVGEQGEVIELCKTLIIKANRDPDIVKHICNLKGIKPQMARKYLNDAYKQLAETYPDNLELERSKASKRYEYLFQQCIKEKQWKNAANIQEKLDRLLGSAAPEKHKHDHELSGNVSVTWNETLTYEDIPNKEYRDD